jgi:hypothetical protein
MTTEVLTWGVAATLAAQEGIKFLCQQVGVLLDRARRRRDERVAKEENTAGADLVATPPAAAFEQAPAEIRLSTGNATIDVESLQRTLEQAQLVISAAQLGRPPSDHALAAASELRALVESLCGQRLTFAGEAREARPVVQVSMVADRVDGVGIGVDIRGGTVPSTSANIEAGTIGESGSLTGVRIG